MNELVFIEHNGDESPKDESPKDESPKDESPKDESPKDESPHDESPKDPFELIWQERGKQQFCSKVKLFVPFASNFLFWGGDISC